MQFKPEKIIEFIYQYKHVVTMRVWLGFVDFAKKLSRLRVHWFLKGGTHFFNSY